MLIATSRLDLTATENELSELESQIKDVPQILVLSKDIGDDALWSHLDGEGHLPDQIRRSALKTEVINSSYSDLFTQLVAARVKVETVRSSVAVLEQEFEIKKQLVTELTRTDTQLQLDKFILEGDRTAELTRLKTDRARQLALAKTQHELDKGHLSGQRTMADRSLERERSVLTTAFSVLAHQHFTARVTKASQEPDVKIGALAVLPDDPIPRGRIGKTLIGGSAGFALALLLTLTGVVFSQATATPTNASNSPASRLTGPKVADPAKKRLVGG